MKLIDMAYTKADQKKQKEAYKNSPQSDDPSYPYGLSIRLDNGSLEKLGVKKLPKVGSLVTVTAKARVTSASQHERTNGDARRDVELQICEMCVGKGEPSSMEEAVGYGADEADE